MEAKQLEVLTRIVERVTEDVAERKRLVDAFTEWDRDDVPVDKTILSILVMAMVSGGVSMHDLIITTGIAYQLGYLEGRKVGSQTE